MSVCKIERLLDFENICKIIDAAANFISVLIRFRLINDGNEFASEKASATNRYTTALPLAAIDENGILSWTQRDGTVLVPCGCDLENSVVAADVFLVDDKDGDGCVDPDEMQNLVSVNISLATLAASGAEGFEEYGKVPLSNARTFLLSDDTDYDSDSPQLHISMVKTACKVDLGVSSTKELTVGITPSYGNQHRTIILTVSPKYLIGNITDMDILVKQEGTSDETCVLIKACSEESAIQIPFHVSRSLSFDTSSVSTERIQLRLLATNSPWSGPFSIDDADDFVIQLRNHLGHRAEHVWVDMNKTENSKSIIFRPSSTSSIPLSIRNKTKSTIWVEQLFTKKQSSIGKVRNLFSTQNQKRKKALSQLEELRTLNKAARIIPDKLLPEEILPFALDYPGVSLGKSLDTEEQSSLDSFPLVVAIMTKIEPMNEMVGIMTRFKPGRKSAKQLVIKDPISGVARVIIVAVKLCGNTYCLEISDSCSTESEVEKNLRKEKENKKRRARKANRDPTTTNMHIPANSAFLDLLPKLPTFEMCVHLSSIGLSLFSTSKVKNHLLLH